MIHSIEPYLVAAEEAKEAFNLAAKDTQPGWQERFRYAEGAWMYAETDLIVQLKRAGFDVTRIVEVLR